MTKVFCAIDTPSRDQAVALAMRLTGKVDGIKVGLEYFTARGPEGIREIRGIVKEDKLFLDLKLHDIPNTVAGAVRAAVHCEADFLTVHTSGGRAMMEAAVAAAREEAEKTGYTAPLILGVTVLTSLDAAALGGVGQGKDAKAQVLRLAALAKDSGLQGLVCSPHEVADLRAALGASMLLVVPGIRPETADAGDQKRVMTPQEAAKAGADWLVIGRPITEAKDPAVAAFNIMKSLS